MPNFQADLGRPTIVTRISTVGDADKQEWVTHYSIYTSLDGEIWTPFKLRSRVHEFAGNTDADNSVSHDLIESPLARYVRVVPRKWHKNPCMGIELWGRDGGVPIGLGNRRVSDAQIMASSRRSLAYAGAAGRIGNRDSCWAAAANAPGEYLQVDIGEIKVLTALAVQGNPSAEEWVTAYHLSTSFDGVHWSSYAENSNQPARLFEGCADQSTAVQQTLRNPVLTRFVRLIPVEWHGALAMRLEVFAYSVGYPLGVANRTISDFCMMCSSALDADHQACHARLGAASAWTPKPEDKEPYLEIALSNYNWVTAILLQGEKGSDAWVTSFSVYTSMDGKTWAPISHPDGGEMFSGNHDDSSMVGLIFPEPALATAVRIWPLSWNGAPALRCELYGRAGGRPAGLESGWLTDAQLSSSATSDDAHSCKAARLNRVVEGGGWTPLASTVDTSTSMFAQGLHPDIVSTSSNDGSNQNSNNNSTHNSAPASEPGSPTKSAGSRSGSKASLFSSGSKASLHLSRRGSKLSIIGLPSTNSIDNPGNAEDDVDSESNDDDNDDADNNSSINNNNNSNSHNNINATDKSKSKQSNSKGENGSGPKGAGASAGAGAGAPAANGKGGHSTADAGAKRASGDDVSGVRSISNNTNNNNNNANSNFNNNNDNNIDNDNSNNNRSSSGSNNKRPSRSSANENVNNSNSNVNNNNANNNINNNNNNNNNNNSRSNSKASNNNNNNNNINNNNASIKPRSSQDKLLKKTPAHGACHDAFLQIDLEHIQSIKAVLTQGSASGREWVTSYEVATSLDGEHWTVYETPGGSSELIGNTNGDLVVSRELVAPPLARFVQIRPKSFFNAPSMRVELLTEDPGALAGLETGDIANEQVTSSSARRDRYGPHAARLFREACWMPAREDREPFFQVDLKEFKLVTGLLTQGNSRSPDWVTAYQFETSLDGKAWAKYLERDGKVKTFRGNSDQESVVSQLLEDPVVARMVRFRPLAWHKRPALRAELTVQSIGQPLGLRTRELPDDQMHASSERDAAHSASQCRLDNAKGAWMPAEINSYQHVELDLKQPRVVSCIMIQGSPSGPEAVNSFTVDVSYDGRSWISYKEHGIVKNFAVVADGGTTWAFALNTHLCRFVQIRPTSWPAAGIALRAELYGRDVGSAAGMQDHKIADAQISSSSDRGLLCAAAAGRLGSEAKGGAWSPQVSNSAQYFQIDLTTPQLVTGVLTQGCAFADEWVTAYSLEYSLGQQDQWQPYGSPAPHHFDGNFDRNTVMSHMLEMPFLARFVRVWPIAWHDAIALRCELFVRNMGIASGMESRELPDASITASSAQAARKPSAARLNGRESWAPAVANGEQYLQVDLGVTSTVTAVLTQGDAATNHCVTAYTLMTSLNGLDWVPVEDEAGNVKVFRGNADGHATQVNALPGKPTARFVRICPVSWNGAPALRAEIFRLPCEEDYARWRRAEEEKAAQKQTATEGAVKALETQAEAIVRSVTEETEKVVALKGGFSRGMAVSQEVSSTEAAESREVADKLEAKFRNMQETTSQKIGNLSAMLLDGQPDFTADDFESQAFALIQNLSDTSKEYTDELESQLLGLDTLSSQLTDQSHDLLREVGIWSKSTEEPTYLTATRIATLLDPLKAAVQTVFKAHGLVPIAAEIQSRLDAVDASVKFAVERRSGETVGIDKLAEGLQSATTQAVDVLRDASSVSFFLEGW